MVPGPPIRARRHRSSKRHAQTHDRGRDPGHPRQIRPCLLGAAIFVDAGGGPAGVGLLRGRRGDPRHPLPPEERRKKPNELLNRRRHDTRSACPHMEAAQADCLDLQRGQRRVRGHRPTIAYRSGRYRDLSASFGRIDVGRLSALFIQEQVQDARTSGCRVRVLSQQAWTPTLAFDRGKARLRGVGRTQLRKTDPQRLARSRQDVSPDLQGGSGGRPVCRGVRHLLGVRPRFLAGRPQLLFARERCRRFLAAV